MCHFAYTQPKITKCFVFSKVRLVDFWQLIVTIVEKGGKQMLKDNLIMLRNLAGFSQEEVAEQVGISRQAYAKWEKGLTIPDVEKCALLAKLYKVTVDTLLKFEPPGEDKVCSPGPNGKHIFGTVTMNEKGQIVIPKLAREVMQLHAGERLVILGDEKEGIALVKVELFERNIEQAMVLAKIEL